MNRPLSTKPVVWKILIVIFLILCAGMAFLFYFRRIFITMVLGIVMIMGTNKLLKNIDDQSLHRHIPLWRRRIYIWGNMLLWLLILGVLIRNEIVSVQEIVRKASDKQIITTLSDLFFGKIVPGLGLEHYVNRDSFESVFRWMLSYLSESLSNVGFIFVNGILIIPIMFNIYFKQRQRITKAVSDRLPDRFRKPFLRGFQQISIQLGDFTRAKLLESIGVASICYVGFYFAGVKAWFLFGSFAGLMNIIPYVGNVLGAIPAVLAGYVESDVTAIYAIITVIIAQLADNFYFAPFMISHKVRMDALLGIILVLVFAKVLGIFGMIVAIPVWLVFQVVISISYEELVRIFDSPNSDSGTEQKSPKSEG